GVIVTARSRARSRRVRKRRKSASEGEWLCARDDPHGATRRSLCDYLRTVLRDGVQAAIEAIEIASSMGTVITSTQASGKGCQAPIANTVALLAASRRIVLVMHTANSVRADRVDPAPRIDPLKSEPEHRLTSL